MTTGKAYQLIAIAIRLSDNGFWLLLAGCVLLLAGSMYLLAMIQ